MSKIKDSLEDKHPDDTEWITPEDYQGHDCKLKEKGYCTTCELYNKQKKWEKINKEIDEGKADEEFDNWRDNEISNEI